MEDGARILAGAAPTVTSAVFLRASNLDSQNAVRHQTETRYHLPVRSFRQENHPPGRSCRARLSVVLKWMRIVYAACRAPPPNPQQVTCPTDGPQESHCNPASESERSHVLTRLYYPGQQLKSYSIRLNILSHSTLLCPPLHACILVTLQPVSC